MTREYVLMVLGALVAISPWSGLPLAWLEWVLLVIGLIIIAVAYVSRPHGAHPRTVPPPAPPAASLPPQPEEPRPRSSHIAFS